MMREIGRVGNESLIVKPKVSMPGDKTRRLERSPLEGDIAMACFLSGYAMQRGADKRHG